MRASSLEQQNGRQRFFGSLLSLLLVAISNVSVSHNAGGMELAESCRISESVSVFSGGHAGVADAT